MTEDKHTTELEAQVAMRNAIVNVSRSRLEALLIRDFNDGMRVVRHIISDVVYRLDSNEVSEMFKGLKTGATPVDSDAVEATDTDFYLTGLATGEIPVEAFGDLKLV